MGKRLLMTMDCETDKFLWNRAPLPFIFGLYDGADFHTFKTADEMMEFLKNKCAVVYAHNGGRFDFIFLQDFLEPHSMIRMINGRMASFKIGDVIFRDSYLILPTALKDYKKDIISYDMMEKSERDKPSIHRKILKYLETDCVALHELVKGFRDEYGSALTIASSGLKFFRDHSNRKIPETNRSHFEFFKPYYHGGRVSCFKSGIYEGDFQFGDINSQYPWALKHRHPWGSKCVILKGILPKENIDRSFIQLTACSLGVFPFLDDNGTLSFPEDGKKRLFHITGHEYLAALETGFLKGEKIVQSIVFSDSIDFNEYVDHFYDLKKRAPIKSKERIYAKTFLTSLYGKFGADPSKYRNYRIVPASDIGAMDGDGFRRDKEENIFEAFIGSNDQLSLVSRSLDEKQQRYYNVAVAASITGFGRAMIWRAKVLSKNPYYCDTDSLLCDRLNAPLSKEIGQWKLEKSPCGHPWRKIGIAGKKLYVLWCKKCPWTGFDLEGNPPPGWKLASKGAKLSGPQLFDIVAGKVVNYKKEAPSMSLKSGTRFIQRNIKRTV